MNKNKNMMAIWVATTPALIFPHLEFFKNALPVITQSTPFVKFTHLAPTHPFGFA